MELRINIALAPIKNSCHETNPRNLNIPITQRYINHTITTPKSPLLLKVFSNEVFVGTNLLFFILLCTALSIFVNIRTQNQIDFQRPESNQTYKYTPSTFKQKHHKNKTTHHTNTNRFSSSKTKTTTHPIPPGRPNSITTTTYTTNKYNRIKNKQKNNQTQPRPQTPTQKQITTHYTISLYTLYQTIHNIHYTPFIYCYNLPFSATFYPTHYITNNYL